MANFDTITMQLKSAGHRLTKLRQALVALFASESLPLAIDEITTYLYRQKLHPNKTSIYRELDFLSAEKIIQVVDFGEGKKRYERFDPENHHHHLICQECDRIEDVQFEGELHVQEREIFQQKKFKVTKHMLEFFGLCLSCQQKG